MRGKKVITKALVLSGAAYAQRLKYFSQARRNGSVEESTIFHHEAPAIHVKTYAYANMG